MIILEVRLRDYKKPDRPLGVSCVYMRDTLDYERVRKAIAEEVSHRLMMAWAGDRYHK